MVNMNVSRRVINLFVQNPKQLLVTKPKIIQMYAEDAVKKLKYLPPLKSDIVALSPQAEKVTKRIAEIKSKVLEVKGEKATYDEFFAKIPDCSEDYKLATWYQLTLRTQMSPNEKKCMSEVAKCFKKENLRKIDFFKNLSEKEIELLNKSKTIDREQLIAVITGHKPAYFDCSREGVINFENAIKGTKYAEDFIAINVKSSPKHFCILNKKQVSEIVEKNKEIYCRELGIDINTPTEDVYKKWIQCIKNEFPSSEKPLAFGLTLGYPKYSSIIYTLQNCFINNNEQLCKKWIQSGEVNMKEYKEVLLDAFRHKDSPFKNYSEEFKIDFENYVRTEDLRNFMNPFKERFYSSFKLYGSDSADMKRIVENEVDFVNNFRMKQLFS